MPHRSLAFLLVVLLADLVLADVAVIADQRFEMAELPDEIVGSPWVRIGGAPAFLAGDGSLVINDNSSDEKIAFEALLGQIEARHHVWLSGRVRVLANELGEAVTLELARPGLEAVLRLRTDRVELAERRGDGRLRWLGAATVDLSAYHEITLEKAPSEADPHETLTVSIDGDVVIRARPRGEGQLGVGRLIVGSLSYSGMGASQWDWWAHRVEQETAQLPAEPLTIGSLKSRYR